MSELSAMESPLVRRLQSWLVAFLLLLGTAMVMSPIERTCWQVVQADLRFYSLNESAGQGAVVGVLGGLRSLVADITWFSLNSNRLKNAAASNVIGTILNTI